MLKCINFLPFLSLKDVQERISSLLSMNVSVDEIEQVEDAPVFGLPENLEEMWDLLKKEGTAVNSSPSISKPGNQSMSFQFPFSVIHFIVGLVGSLIVLIGFIILKKN